MMVIKDLDKYFDLDVDLFPRKYSLEIVSLEKYKHGLLTNSVTNQYLEQKLKLFIEIIFFDKSTLDLKEYDLTPFIEAFFDTFKYKDEIMGANSSLFFYFIKKANFSLCEWAGKDYQKTKEYLLLKSIAEQSEVIMASKKLLKSA